MLTKPTTRSQMTTHHADAVNAVRLGDRRLARRVELTAAALALGPGTQAWSDAEEELTNCY